MSTDVDPQPDHPDEMLKPGKWYLCQFPEREAMRGGILWSPCRPCRIAARASLVIHGDRRIRSFSIKTGKWRTVQLSKALDARDRRYGAL